MSTESDLIRLMKEVGRVAASRVQSNSIVGLGTGSTVAFAIQFLGERPASRAIQKLGEQPTLRMAIGIMLIV